MSLIICKSVGHLRQQLAEERAKGRSIGFVPTMGALHAGHLSLLETALDETSVAVCSIFVNPTQFNDAKDLERYPRTPEKDLAMLEQVGCHYLFMPDAAELYAANEPLLDINLGDLDKVMEGAYRSGHFKGVATIVDKLFMIVEPHCAYFGEKDFQQLAIIRSMAKQMNHQLQIIGCATLREADGLAMSSRNLLLSEKQRKAAPLIYQALQKAQEFIPYHSVDAVRTLVIRYIEQNPLLRVQYFNIVNPETLENVIDWKEHHIGQGCIAVLTEGPRLIDNISYTISQ